MDALDFVSGSGHLMTMAPPKPAPEPEPVPEPEFEPTAPSTRDTAPRAAGRRSELELGDAPPAAIDNAGGPGAATGGKTYEGHVDFKTAKDDVTSQATLDGALDRFAADFKALPPEDQKALLSNPNFRIDVTGNASNSGNATNYDNQGLSSRRADHTASYVRDYLAKEGIDVPKSAIHANGDGTPGTPPKPIENNDQTDRRAKLKITVPEVEAKQPKPEAPEAPKPEPQEPEVRKSEPQQPEAPKPKPELQQPEAPKPKPELQQPEAPKPRPEPQQPEVLQQQAPAPRPAPPQPPVRLPADPQPELQLASNGPSDSVLPQILGAIAAIGQILDALAAQPEAQGQPLPEPLPRPIIIDIGRRPAIDEGERRKLEEEARKRLEEEEAKKREDILIDPRAPIQESPYKTPVPETLGGWKSPEIDPVNLPKETPGGLRSDNSWKAPVSDAR